MILELRIKGEKAEIHVVDGQHGRPIAIVKSSKERVNIDISVLMKRYKVKGIKRVKKPILTQ